MGERQVILKAKEFKLLKCLFEHRNTIVSKEMLFDVEYEHKSTV